MSSAPHVPPQLPIPYGQPLSLELAKRVMAAAETEAVAHHFPQVIVIVDSGGNLVMLHRLDQADLGSISVAQAKAQTAVNFRVPTKVLAEALASGGLVSYPCPTWFWLKAVFPLLLAAKLSGLSA